MAKNAITPLEHYSNLKKIREANVSGTGQFLHDDNNSEAKNML